MRSWEWKSQAMLIWRWDIHLILLLYCLDMTSANHINFKWSLENNAKFLIFCFTVSWLVKKKSRCALNQSEWKLLVIASGSCLVYTLSFHRPLPILAAAIALVLIFDSQSKCTETFPHKCEVFSVVHGNVFRDTVLVVRRLIIILNVINVHGFLQDSVPQDT